MNLSLTACCVICVLAQAEEPSKLTGDAASYRSYCLETLEFYRAKHFRKTDAFLRDNDHLNIVSLAAAMEVRAWQWTKNEAYAKSAVERIRNLIAKEAEFREVDFFTPYPLTFAWQGVAESEFVDAELKRAMQQFASKRFVAKDFTSLNNQTIIRACGLELAAQQWPDAKEAEKWHAYAVAIYDLLAKTEDIPENAPNYNSLDLVGVFILSDLLKQPELLAKPGMRAMFLRYRDQVTPAGWIPPYGDSGSAPRPFNAAWPMRSPWAHYVAAFERAAHEWRDPTLRWAALRMAQEGPSTQPMEKYYVEIESLFYLSFAVDWTAANIQPQQPKSCSAILHRRDFTETSALDKMILNSSRKSGSPFVLCDLYCRGYHGHVNQHGGISYFEVQNYPLLTVLGYNSRDPEHTNLVMLRPAEDAFPHIPGIFKPNAWHTAQLPTLRLPVVDAAQPFLRRIEQLNLRVDAAKDGVTLWADDMQLTGSSREPLVIDDFNAANTWSGKPTLSDDIPADAPASKHSLTWQIGPGTKFIEKKKLDYAFDCRDYPTLSFRWKLSNSDERSRPIILRVSNGKETLDFHAHAIQLAPILTNAKVDQHGDDQFGVMEFDDWFTPGTKLRRQMVLTKTGILIVRDVITSSKFAAGKVAGPIWHMGSSIKPTEGPNWFNSTGGKLDLLTWFEPAVQRTFGMQTVSIWNKETQHTVFAKQALQSKQPVCFVTVLVPHAAQITGDDLAKKIKSTSTLEKSVIELSLPTETVHIEMNSQENWQVTR